MTGKEQLWYLINGILEGAYDVETFCDEFTRIYDLEIDYETLSKTEKKEFGDLSEMTARFSNDDEELKIPNMYYSTEEVLQKVNEIKNKLYKNENV